MSMIELRIELPDHPGALAAVARELARLEMNVVEIAIHEVDGSRAVDEIIVSTRHDLDRGLLVTALAAAGAELLSARSCQVRLDPVVASMTWLAESVDRPHDRQTLACGIQAVTGIDDVQLVPAAVAADCDVCTAAIRRGRPVVQRVAEVPEFVAGAAAGPRWLLAAPDGPDPQWVVVATRAFSVRFTATEVRRLSAILDSRRHLLRAVVAAGAFS
ncbi:MAG: hypothetical protein QOD07_2525 [Frankiaceae bacterium]|jgi:hypothetical protein|nr:hypothetical protein [Frankiaceae bacterium]